MTDYNSACRGLADRLFEIIRKEDAKFSLDALGLAMTRTLLEVVPAKDATHRQIFEDFLQHTRLAGERVMKVLDQETWR
jgi:hypothetical protein